MSNLVANGDGGQETTLDREVNQLTSRLMVEGWPWSEAVQDARAACGARWSRSFGRHVYIGYADGPKEAI